MSSRVNSAAQRDARYVLHGYTNLKQMEATGPGVMTGGKGIYVFDENGRPFIEASAGMWCTSLGFSESELVEAAARQMRTMPYYQTAVGKSVMPSIDLAERIVKLVPIPNAKVYFCVSGSEANDFLVKFIRYYNNAIGRPAKKKIISRINGYHGATLGATSLTGILKNHKLFDLPLPGFLHTDDPNYYHEARLGESEEAFADRLAANLEAMIVREGPETVAAFFAEPVAGSSGVTIPPPGYYKKIQAVLAKYDVMFCADEVITGFCRTGNMFGCETMGIKPDAMTLAKGITSAYQPLAAIVVSDKIFRGLQKGTDETAGFFAHGATYSGHPVGCAVGVRVLELIEERGILAHVRRVSKRFADRIHAFADHPLVGETRAVGLMGAIELVADKATKATFAAGAPQLARVHRETYKRGAMVRLSGPNIILSPALTIERPQLDLLCDALEGAFAAAEA